MRTHFLPHFQRCGVFSEITKVTSYPNRITILTRCDDSGWPEVNGTHGFGRYLAEVQLKLLPDKAPLHNKRLI